MAVRLLLARHGQTSWNVEGRYQGSTDIPLNAHGLEQAAALAARLAAEPLDVIYSSPLQRAHQTAEAVAAYHGLPVHDDPRLQEIGFGSWEGITHQEAEVRDPGALRRWRRDPFAAMPPDGEAIADVEARIAALLRDLAAHEGQTALLASHCAILQVLLCQALRMDLAGRWRFRLDPAALSELILDPNGNSISYINDRHHLRGLGVEAPEPILAER